MQYPEIEFRAAGGIKASVWLNKKTNNNGSNFKNYSVTIQKSYQDEMGQWQSSNTYFRDDLPKLQLVLTKAYEYIALKKD